MESIINKLNKDIKNDESFYCNGTNEINNDNLKLFFINKEKKTDCIKLPYEVPLKIESLINSCEIAKFGRGDITVEDKSYRHAYQLIPELFSLDNNLDIYKMGIINEIQQILKYDINVKDIYTDLYCLNIYTKNGFFKSHIDTPKSDKMFGSLVISLPSDFTGGILKVRHNNECKEFNLSTNNKTEIKWVAFYSDCEHEITKVTNGYRITLTYNLYIRKNYETQYKNFDIEKVELYNTLKEIKNCNYNNIKKLGFMMEHKYPNLINFDEKTNFIKILKGYDLKLFLICKRLNLDIEFKGIIELNNYIDIDDDKICKHFKEIFGNYYSENPCESITGNILLITDDLTINNGDQYYDIDTYHGIKDFLEEIKNSGAEYDKYITWVNNPKNWTKSSSYMAYGNEAETRYHYVTGAFIINLNKNKYEL